MSLFATTSVPTATRRRTFQRRIMATAGTALLAVLVVSQHAGAATATAMLVRDINPGTAHGIDNTATAQIVGMDGLVYFAARSADGAGLWRSDGTEAGTDLVFGPLSVGSLTNVDGTLFFVNGPTGSLWKSDGTAEGTVQVRQICPSFSLCVSPDGLTSVGGKLFFVGDDGVSGRELWTSDGTAEGTFMVKDIAPGDADSNPGAFVDLNGTLLFSAFEGVSSGQHGRELWRSDGTPEGTFMVEDIRPGTGTGGFGVPTVANGSVLFSANDGLTGSELWRTDGTEAGTELVRDIQPGSGSSIPDDLVDVNGTVFFSANDGVNGVELWRSDGTEGGTHLVKDIVPGSGNLAFPAEFTNVDGTLFFAASDGIAGFELWRSDGTADGTWLVDDIRGGSRSSSPSSLTAINDTLFFSATDGSSGVELWQATNAPDSAVQVADINPGSASSSPGALAAVGSILYFVADDGTHGRELWKASQNQPPEIEPIPDQLVDEHILLGVAPLVTDPEGDPYTLTWEGLPAGAVTDGDVLSWTPAEDQGPGSYVVSVIATQDDNPSLFDSETFTIDVLEVNEQPILDPIADLTVLTGDLVSFEVTASDPDIPVNELTFALGTAPDGATLAPLQPAQFSWAACSCPTGTYPVEVIVSDGELSDTLTFTITVQNRPPAIEPIPDEPLPEGEPIVITPLVDDPEGDPFSLSWSGDVAPNAAINGIFSWTPDEAQGPGDYTITVTATQDSEPTLTASQSFTISVTEVNEPPVLAAIGPQEGVEGVPVEFQATASDPDLPANTLTFSMTPLSGDLSGASIDATTGQFTCGCATGEHLVRIEVSDGTLTDVEDVTIAVAPATPSADLQVSLMRSNPGAQYFVGEAVPYTVLIHNAGPDAVTAELTVDPEHHDQTTWGAVPPEAAINGIFFLSLGELEPGVTVQVSFETVYEAFGVHDLTATVAGSYDELVPGDEADVSQQQIDLPLGTPGVETGGLTIGAAHTTDGEPLAVMGVRVPYSLIAGSPPGDLFVPSDLSPHSEMPAGWFFLPQPYEWVAGDLFIPAPAQILAGDLFIPEIGDWPAGDLLVAARDHRAAGEVRIPALDASNEVPAGRLLFADGLGTDALISEHAAVALRIGRHAPPSKWDEGGLAVEGEGGLADGTVELCEGNFKAMVGHGDGAAFKCGSLTAEVIAGEIVVELDDGTTLQVPQGALIEIVETAAGGHAITLAEGGPVTITPPVGDPIVLNEGETTQVGGDANEAPVADAGGPYLGAVDTDIQLEGSASDADGDALTYTWTAQGGSLADASSLTPVFAAPAAGIYTVSLEVCDPSPACEVTESSVVVYDPDGGFVTGGGWIESPAGACGEAAPEGLCEDDPTGKATFGFVAKYKKGADAPDGQTAFIFQAGSLRFDSDSYAWLVVSGQDRAQFKGTGSLNGVGGYEFMLTAYDGGTDGTDGFRIKIWTADGLVYDNRDGSDDALNQANTQVIGGGSIVIHRK